MFWESYNKFRRLFRTSIIKSIFLNFKMLPICQAIRFPIIVSRYTYFYSLSGNIELISPVRFGMVRIGFLGEDVVVPKSERSLLQIEGRLKVGSNVRIGCGAIIRVENDADLTLEDNVRVGSKTRIIAYDNIIIGRNSGMSWECQIMDSNMHDIVDLNTGNIIPLSKGIIIGANNWIGTRCSIMKGCITPDYTIVSAVSVCNKDYSSIPQYSILAGAPAKLIKSGYKRADFK